MRETSCEVILNLEDPTAKADSQVTTSNNSTFADINVLEKDGVLVGDYGTLELNQFLLDGTKAITPTTVSDSGYGLFGTSLSDELLARSSVTLNVDFTQTHKSMGITFNFANDYPNTIRIVWYNGIVVLNDITFTPNSLEYTCENKVEGYNKLLIVLSGSNVPYRYLRLDSITYGANLTFDVTKLKSAEILEEVDPLSKELSINNADFTILDQSKDFNVLNPTGKYSLIQRGQKVYVKEKIDSSIVDMGTFYLDNWSSDSETLISFNAVDALGMLSGADFYKGKIYNQVPAGTIISEIMASASWTKYTVTTEVANTLLTGYIGICTHREALQQVAFATRSVADCSRSDKIKIYRQEVSPDIKLNYNRKFQNGKVGVRSYVSAVKLSMHSYVLGAETKQLFKGTLQVGTNLITFSNPSSVTTMTGTGIISEQGVNYAIVTATVSEEVIISGKEYTDNTSTLTVQNSNKLSGEQTNIVTVKDATLVSQYDVYLTANHIMNYYALQREANQKFICESEHVGRWINMKSQYEMFVTGSIESMKIDLTGGFIADAKIIGYNSLEKDTIYTGTAFYTGETIGAI